MCRGLYRLRLYKFVSNTSNDLCNILRLACPTKLNQAQITCFLSGLRDRVSLIQDPSDMFCLMTLPFSRANYMQVRKKSFIDSLLTKASYTHFNEAILMIYYTHYALDQFFEGLLKTNISNEDIIRLESVNKATPRTRFLTIKQTTSNVRLSREQCQVLDMIKAESSDEGDRLRHAFTNLEQAKFSKNDILEHLGFLSTGLSYYSAFEISSERSEMIKIGKKGKAVDRLYLLDRWRRKDAGTFKRIAATFSEV